MPRSVTASVFGPPSYSPTAPRPTIPQRVIVFREFPAATLQARLGPGNYRALARASGVSRQHVSRVLRGKAVPSLPVASRLAKAAGITVSVLQTWIEGVS
jgi:transcriptional regulator with XRE-family HTH domain